jgi:phosphoribosylformylglycinamidine synthase
MKFTAEIQIIPLPEVIEPQGKTLQKHIHQLPIEGINQIRVGKFIILQLDADSETDAHEKVTKTCEKLLAHPLVETYSFSLQIVEDSEPIPHQEPQPEATEESLPEAEEKEQALPPVEETTAPNDKTEEE